MSLTPGFNAEVTDGVTAVTLLSSPDAGTSRLVELITVYNGFFGAAQPFTLYLENGGTAYNLFYDATFAFGTNTNRPLAANNSPIILENGWTLKAVTSAAADDDIYITANYADDEAEGGGSSLYHIVGLEGGDLQWDTLVSEPDSGKVRIVAQSVFSNDDIIDHHYALSMYDGSTNYTFFSITGVTADAVGWCMGTSRPIVVPNGWEVQAKTFVAEDTNPSYWTAHYMECDDVALDC